MYLTEDEAKQKWCPKARMLDGYHGDQSTAAAATNRMGNEWGNVFCIASQCMAWRWRDPDNWSGTPEENRRGYCGAFGKPDHD